MSAWIDFAEAPIDGVGGATPVTPGRPRKRTPRGEDSVPRQTPDERGKKKAPAARKAPGRGRFVDEYARPR